MPKIELTAQQKSFVDALVNGTSNICLRARAGTGKTSTILAGIDAYADAHPHAEVLVCAFNKAITDEVRDKLIAAGHTDWRKCQASTAHSLGLSTFKWMFKPKINEHKVRDIVDAMIAETNDSDRQLFLYAHKAQVHALVHMAKQAGFGFFSDLPIGDVSAWHHLADHYDINGLDDTSAADAIVDVAQDVYRKSLAMTDVVDFDDMILFPLVKNIRVKFTKDLIIVDEAQDLSRARQALLLKYLGRNGRMVIVGDDRQAIYGFSGADAAALHNFTEQLDAQTLPLSVTWRCPRAVVELAQTIVPDIEAAPTAADGEIVHLDLERPAEAEDGDPIAWYTEIPLTADDAVLCRNTAPLISLAYKLIRAGTPCKVEGRAIGNGLKVLALRWKITTIAALLKRLDTYAERERQKAVAKGNDAKAEEVTDRVTTLIEICNACLEDGEKHITDVVDRIDALFADGAQGVTILATYHRSKGREWPMVFLLEHHTRCPSKAARKPWQRAQEDNLAYVAFTRAQQTLVFVG